MSNPYPFPYDAHQRRGSPQAARSDRAVIGIIFGVAFLLRIAYWFVMKQNYFFCDHPSSDVLYYQEWAREISRGSWIGTKTFFGLPLYPYFLALLDRLSLGNAAWVRWMHLLMGSLNCSLIYAVAARIFSRRVAMLSGLLLAGNFSMIHYDWLMMPVTLIVSLSLVIVLSLIEIDHLKKRERFILGFLIGLAALGDGKILIFSGLVFFYLLYRYRKNPTGRLPGIALPLIAGVMLPLLITGVRNKMVGGDWIWITAQRGLSFYVGNHSKATGVFDNPYFIRPTHQGQDEDQVMVAEMLAKRPLTPSGVSRFWQSQAMAFIRHQPLEYLRLLGRKFRLFFTETEEAYDLDLVLQREWKSRWDINPFPVMCSLAMLGMAAARRNRGHARSDNAALSAGDCLPTGTLPVCASRADRRAGKPSTDKHGPSADRQTIYLDFMLVSQLVFTIVFFLTHRHRATIFPFFIVYESFCILWLADQVRSKNFKRLSFAAGFFVLFLFVFRPQAMAQEDVAFYRWTKSGAVYEKRQDLARARECYSHALALRPQDTNALYNLANAYAIDGDFAPAKEHYQKILAFNPYQVDALYNLGFVEEKMGNYAQSLAWYAHVLDLQPQSPDALLQIAQVHQRLGDCDSAGKYYAQLMRLTPQFAREIQDRMAQCP